VATALARIEAEEKLLKKKVRATDATETEEEEVLAAASEVQWSVSNREELLKEHSVISALNKPQDDDQQSLKLPTAKSPSEQDKV